MVDLNLADIQGFILRGYNMPLVRHFVLQIQDVAGSKQFLASLVNGDAASSPDHHSFSVDGKAGLLSEHWIDV